MPRLLFAATTIYRFILGTWKEERRGTKLPLLNSSVLFPLLPPHQMWLKCFVVMEEGSSLASDHEVDCAPRGNIHVADIWGFTVPCSGP